MLKLRAKSQLTFPSRFSKFILRLGASAPVVLFSLFVIVDGRVCKIGDRSIRAQSRGPAIVPLVIIHRSCIECFIIYRCLLRYGSWQGPAGPGLSRIGIILGLSQSPWGLIVK